jgi:hypothetical protein
MKTKHDNLLSLLFYYSAIVYNLQLNKTAENFVTKWMHEYEHFSPSHLFIYLLIYLFIYLFTYLFIYLLNIYLFY